MLWALHFLKTATFQGGLALVAAAEFVFRRVRAHFRYAVGATLSEDSDFPMWAGASGRGIVC